MPIKKYLLSIMLLLFVSNAFSQPRHLKAHMHINLQRQIKRLNAELMKHVEYHPQVKLLNDSVFLIQHDSNTVFRVNVLRLKQKVPQTKHFMKGIEFQPMQEGAHVPVSFIYFRDGKDAFIKMYDVDYNTGYHIFSDFEHMVSLMHAWRRGR